MLSLTIAEGGPGPVARTIRPSRTLNGGYRPPYAAAVTVASAIIGPIIPPSGLAIIMPAVLELGIDPIHAAVVIMLTLAVGLITPPVGVVLFVIMRIGRLSMGPLLRALLPFLLAEIAAILLLVIFPPLSTWLPAILR